ncbi:MAG: hypothetical protein ACI8ZM_003807 [Crocinitomix sp.]|jgi:hypothetical protein
MKRLLCLLFCILSINAYNQTTRLTGTIIADAESIDLGEIVIFSQADTSLKKGTYLDSSYFSVILNTRNEQDFIVQFSIPTYLDTIIFISAKDSVFDMGNIVMVKNLDLDAVDVRYRREMFTRTMDGVSVRVEGTNLQALTNLFEVLKASPKIISPDDENIEIVGRGTPLILVDRQPIISNDELKAIPASEIERIEIITNPSARYKAQGSGNGVIEVFTKNFHFQGYNITVRTEAGINTRLKPQGGLHLGISLKKNKFSLSGYLGTNYNVSVGLNDFLVENTEGFTQKVESFTEFESGNLSQYYSLRGSYDISNKQRLSMGINGNGDIGSSVYNASTKFRVLTTDIFESNADLTSSWTRLNNKAFINYVIDTDTNYSNLEINFNYVNKVGNTFGQSESVWKYLDTGEIEEFDIRNDSRDIPHLGELRIIYAHVFDTTGWQLSGGASYSILLNGKRLESFTHFGDEWVSNPEYSNSYDYQEHNGGVFFEVSKMWNKVGMRAGLRAESTTLNGYSNSLDKEFIDSTYILPFPSASIFYEPNEKLAINLFYKAGIDRPQFEQYDPFVRVQDSLIIEYGNPYLRPSTEQTFGLDMDLFRSINLTVNYRHKKAPMSSFSFIEEETFLLETTPWNAELQQDIGGSLGMPLRGERLTGWNSVWMSYSKYTFTPIFGRDPFFNVTFGVFSYMNYEFRNNFNISSRISINKYGTEETESNVVFNLGLRAMKNYRGGNFQIFADAGNIIPPTNRQTSYSGNFKINSVSQNNFTYIKIGLFYKFGRLIIDTNIRDSESEESDRL